MQHSLKSDSLKKTSQDPKRNSSGRTSSEFKSPSLDDASFLIKDYLKKKNLLKTFEIFEKESKSLCESSDRLSTLFKRLEQGSSKEFFQIYEELQKGQPFNKPVQENDKLEFYFNVYFAIYEVHPFLGNKKELNRDAINDFKTYLEEKGADLAKFHEIIPFFALPYIKNPKEHATFKHLFTQNWLTTIKQDLNNYLASIAESNGNTELEHLISTMKSGNSGFKTKSDDKGIEELKKTLQFKSNEVEEMKQNFKKLEGESKETMKTIHQKWAAFVKLLK